MAVSVDSTEIFSNLSSKIGNLLYGRTRDDWNILSKTLDELNSINYRYTVVTSQTKAVLLVNQCCSFIPTDDKVLVKKCSQLLRNIINRQNVIVEGRTLIISVQWCLNALKIKNDDTVVLDVLQALEALLRSNTDNIAPLTGSVTKDVSCLIGKKKEEYSLEVLLLSLQCLEACTAIPSDFKLNKHDDIPPHLDLCAKIFMFYLCKKPISVDDLVYSKILKVCLSGLQNVILQDSEYLAQELGSILGVVKTFMLYGIKSIDYIAPQKILPSTLSIPEVSNNILREKKGGKLTKQRKHRVVVSTKKQIKNAEQEPAPTGYTPATTSLEYNSDSSLNLSCRADSSGGIRTSDSDFSDNEAGRKAKVGHVHGRIRQTALYLFCDVVKQTDKATVFSYWTSFIPEGTMCGPHNLVTCILKDPAARGRMAALNVLLLLLTSSKLYLLQAESSEKSTSFTPFSVILGFMLKELHKGLSLALNEMSAQVLTQVLKCFGALVQATPYHRMSPGLITKVVRNVKGFIYYKDCSVQVTALIVLGCILASEPVISESKEVMLRLRNSLDDKSNAEQPNKGETQNTDDFDYAEFSDPEEEESTDNVHVPWLLKRCLMNLSVTFQTESNSAEQKNSIKTTPVKLESLQVLSAMSRNYFDILMAPHITHIIKALVNSLSDKSIDLRLHAGRTVDFLGQAMYRHICGEDVIRSVSMQQCLQFWQTLLDGSLIELLQSEQHFLRAVGCDCLGSIGPEIFEQLPRDKQLLCVTLLFSCTRDEENCVKAAAVRALAILVLYPSLREDPGFIVDTAEAIYRTLKDENLMVRVKASWSLGNLSEALVLNSNCGPFSIEDIPDDLILKLFHASIGAENDKIKMNTVRAIGNLLQLINPRLLQNSSFVDVTEQAFSTLVKASTKGSNMKVRWNACHALGKAMKNPTLYQDATPLTKSWQGSVFNSLMDLVTSFRNFKVRINAVVALSSPTNREHYGQFFLPLWVSLLKTLENSHNIEDFNEYKHRDHLVEQICLTMGHLTTLLHKDDLLQLNDTIEMYFDAFKTNTHKVLERLVPEKSTILFSTSYTLSTLYKQTDLTEKQKSVVQRLMDIFVPEF